MATESHATPLPTSGSGARAATAARRNSTRAIDTDDEAAIAAEAALSSASHRSSLTSPLLLPSFPSAGFGSGACDSSKTDAYTRHLHDTIHELQTRVAALTKENVLAREQAAIHQEAARAQAASHEKARRLYRALFSSLLVSQYVKSWRTKQSLFRLQDLMFNLLPYVIAEYKRNPSVGTTFDSSDAPIGGGRAAVNAAQAAKLAQERSDTAKRKAAALDVMRREKARIAAEHEAEITRIYVATAQGEAPEVEEPALPNEKPDPQRSVVVVAESAVAAAAAAASPISHAAANGTTANTAATASAAVATTASSGSSSAVPTSRRARAAAQALRNQPQHLQLDITPADVSRMSQLKRVKRGERLFSTPLVDLTGYLEGVFEMLQQATIALITRLPLVQAETEKLAQRNIEMNAELAAQVRAHSDESRELRELRSQLETLRGEHQRLQKSYALVRGDYDQALDQMQLQGLWKPGRETRIQSMATAHISRVEFARPKERGRSASASRSRSRSVSPAAAAGVGAESRARHLSHSGSLSTMRRAQSAKMARRTPLEERAAAPRRRLSLTVTSTPASPAAPPAAAASASGSPRGASNSLANSSVTPVAPSEPLDAATLALLAEDNSETDFLFQRPLQAAQPQPRSAQSTQRHQRDGPASHLAALASSVSLDEFADPSYFGEEEKELYGGVVALKSAQEQAREREREGQQHVSRGRQPQRGWVVAEPGSMRPLSPSPSPSRPSSSSAGRARTATTTLSPQRGHTLSRSSAALAGARARELSPARPTAAFTSNKKFDLRDIGGTNMHLGCSSTSFDYHTFSVPDAAVAGGNNPAINREYDTYQGRERPAQAGRRPSSSPSRHPSSNNHQSPSPSPSPSPSRSRPSSRSQRPGSNSSTNSHAHTQSAGGRRALSAVNRGGGSGGGSADVGPRRALQYPPPQQHESADQAEQRAWELQRQLGKPRRTALEMRGLHEVELDHSYATGAGVGSGGIVIRDEDDGDSDAEEAAQAEPRRHRDHQHHSQSASSKHHGPSRSPGRPEAQLLSSSHGHAHAGLATTVKRSATSNSHFRSPAQAQAPRGGEKNSSAQFSPPPAATKDPVAAYYNSLSVDSDALIVSQAADGGAFVPALRSSTIRHIATKHSVHVPQDKPKQGRHASPGPAALLARAQEVHALAGAAATSAPRPISARAPLTSKQRELDARDTAAVLAGKDRYEKFVREIDDDSHAHAGGHAHSAPHEQSSRSSTHRSAAASSPSPDISALVIERFVATGGDNSEAARAAEQQRRARAAELAAKVEAARADLRREQEAKAARELAQLRLQQQEKLSQLIVAEDHAAASVFATSAQATAVAAELLRKRAVHAAAVLSSLPPPPAKQEHPPAPAVRTEPIAAATSAPEPAPQAASAAAPAPAPAPEPVDTQPSDPADSTPTAAHANTHADSEVDAQPSDSSSSAPAAASAPALGLASVVDSAPADPALMAVDVNPWVPATTAASAATAATASSDAAASAPAVSSDDASSPTDSSASASFSGSAADSAAAGNAIAIAPFRFTVPAVAPVMAAASTYAEDFVSVEAAHAAAAAAWGDDGDADGSDGVDGVHQLHGDFGVDGNGRALLAVKEEDEDETSQTQTRAHSRSHSASVNATREDSRRNSSAQRLARFKANVKSANAEA